MEKELEDFIKKAANRGIAPEDVKKLLEQSGWDNSEIEEGLERFKLIDFVNKAKERGVSTDKIREALLNSGWKKEEINEVLKKEFHLPKINFVIIVKPIVILLVVILLVMVAWQILPSISFSFQKTSHHLDLSHTEFNESLYNTNINSYLKNISKSCGSKSVVIMGNIMGDSSDFSDVNISSNIGSLKANYINSSGDFGLEINCVGEIILSFSKEGFVPLHKKVSLYEGSNYLSILLIRENDFTNFNISNEFDIENYSVSLHFLDNSFSDVKTAKVSLTPFDSVYPSNVSYFPGDSRALDINGNMIGVESFGFFKIKVEDLDGNGLNLINNKTINGSLRINDKQKNLAPKKVALWNFNEQLGIWVYVGEAVKRCGNVCYYDFTLKKVGSWFNIGVPTDGGAKLSISGFDYSAPQNRVDVVMAPIVPRSGPSKVDLKSGETIENLDKVKTGMVCTQEEVSGYDRKSLVDYSEDVIAGFFVFSTTTKTDYFGRGVAQVVKDADGNMIREIETECTCRETVQSYNRNTDYDCDSLSRYENDTFYDGCVKKTTSFSCAETNPCDDPCQDFETFKKCNPDFERYYNAAKSFEEQFGKDNGRDPSALEFFRSTVSSDMKGYEFNPGSTSIPDKLKPFIYRGGDFDKEEKERTASAYKSFSNKLVNRNIIGNDDRIKKVSINGNLYNMDHVQIAVIARAFIPTQFAQDVVDEHIDYPKLDKRAQPQNFNGNRIGTGLSSASIGSIDSLTPSKFLESVFFNYMCINEKNYLDENLVYHIPRFDGQMDSIIRGLQGAIYSPLNYMEFMIKQGTFLTGNFIFNIDKKDYLSSLFSGVDVNSGKIHYPINDFVYYSELPSFKDKLDGDLVVYDSFIVNNEGIYFIGSREGVFRLIENNSLLIKEDSIIKIKGDDSSFEFGKNVGDMYFITKSNLVSGDIEIETNYFYTDGKLSKIESGEERVSFGYDKNRLVNIVYDNYESNLVEEFIYDGKKLSKILYKVDNETVLETNYTRGSNYFEVKDSLSMKKFLLDGNRVGKIEMESTLIDNSPIYIIDFEYDDDYTYITSDNYTTTCYKGLCFIDELSNILTTSSRCLDYYPNSSETNDFDNFILRVQGIDSSGGFVWNEVMIDRNKINKLVEIEIPSSANLSVFIELNGVPSNPINFISGNKILNISSLLSSPKNCNNVGISFGGFSLENCKIYSDDLDKLTKCLVGSVGMFNISREDLISFTQELDTNENVKEGAISFLEKRFN